MKCISHLALLSIIISGGSTLAMERTEIALIVQNPVIQESTELKNIEHYLLMARFAQHAYRNSEKTIIADGVEDNSSLITSDVEFNALLTNSDIEYLGTITDGRNSQIRIVAFYQKKTGTIIYSVRGTVPTNFTNLLADLGIGRLKTNEDLLKSLDRAQKNLHEHGVAAYEKTEGPFGYLKTLIESRVTSTNSYVRMFEPLYRGPRKGFISGFSTFYNICRKPFTSGLGRATSVVAGTSAATTTALGASATLAGPAAVATGGFVFAASAGLGTAGLLSLINGTYEGTKETFKSFLTVNDGFEHLLDHIKLLKRSLDKITEHAKIRRYKIKNTVWVGHSLGGYLATLGALLTNGNAFTFNAPGLCIEEAAHLAHQAGILTDVNPLLLQRESIPNRILHIRNRTCTIGLLGDRDGTIAEYCRHTYQGSECSSFCDALRLEQIILEEHAIETLITILKTRLEELQKQSRIIPADLPNAQ